MLNLTPIISILLYVLNCVYFSVVELLQWSAALASSTNIFIFSHIHTISLSVFANNLLAFSPFGCFIFFYDLSHWFYFSFIILSCMLLCSLACSIRPTSILKGSRRKRVSLPPLGKVTRAGVNHRLTPNVKVLTLIWAEKPCCAQPILQLTLFAITSAFALFSQMFCVVAAFYTENPPVLITYPQLSVCCLVHNNKVIFHIYRYFIPSVLHPPLLCLFCFP